MNTDESSPAQTPEQPDPQRPSRRRRLIVVAVGLIVLAIPFYVIYWAADRISFKADIERHNGSVGYDVPASIPAWMGRVFGIEYVGLVAEPSNLVATGNWFDRRWLKRIRGMTHLVEMRLQHASLTDDDLTDLAGLRNLHLLELDDMPIGDAGLEHLRSFTEFTSLAFRTTKITGRGLSCLAGNNLLRFLSVEHTPIEDDDLEQLKPFASLEILALGQTRVSGPGLKHLSTLGKLRLLSLNFTPLDDRGLAMLPSLPRLETLQLAGTKITDAGLARLATAAPALKRLDLEQTRVTPDGVARLQQALPGCKIVANRPRKSK